MFADLTMNIFILKHLEMFIWKHFVGLKFCIYLKLVVAD